MNTNVCALDGGWLLHQVKWISGASVQTIVDDYITYVQSKFSDCTVVFDGHGEEPSTKDHEDMRRMSGKKVSADLTLTSQLILTCERETFLANKKNKAAVM